MSELVFAAFEALGMAATTQDVARVANALRETGDADVFALFGEPDPDAPFDDEACAAVAEIAVQAGAGGLVALDLYTEFICPGWSPFPAAGSEERTAFELAPR
jgi:hypothetical protein